MLCCTNFWIKLKDKYYKNRGLKLLFLKQHYEAQELGTLFGEDMTLKMTEGKKGIQ